MAQHHIALIATFFFLAPLAFILYSELQQARDGAQARIGLIFSSQARSAFLNSNLGRKQGGNLLIRLGFTLGMLILASRLSGYSEYFAYLLFVSGAVLSVLAWLNILKLNFKRLSTVSTLLLPAALVNLLVLFEHQDFYQSFVTLTAATVVMMVLEFYGYLYWFLKEKLAHQGKKNP